MHLRHLIGIPLISVFVACGGGLSHTVDDASVAALDADGQTALAPTQKGVSAAEAEKKSADSAYAKAENDVTKSEEDVAAKESMLERAREQLKFEEARKSFLEGRQQEAELAVVAAQAKHELAKAKAVGKTTDESANDYNARIARFEAQLAEAEEAHAAARQTSANRKEAMHEAKQEVGDM